MAFAFARGSVKQMHLESSTATSLSRNYDPVTQDKQQTFLLAVLEMDCFLMKLLLSTKLRCFSTPGKT